MNPRLRELMVEAGYASPEIAKRAQVLAELIVKECASIADAGNAVAVASVIREQFGVNITTPIQDNS